MAVEERNWPVEMGRSGLERARPVPIAARALGLAFAPFVALLREVPVTVTWLGLALDAWRELLGMAPRVACDGECAIRDDGIGERALRESAATCAAAALADIDSSVCERLSSTSFCTRRCTSRRMSSIPSATASIDSIACCSDCARSDLYFFRICKDETQ